MITHILRVCRHFWTASCLHVAKISLTMILFAAIAPLELAQAQCSQFDKICNVLATDGTSANSVRVDWNQWGGANGLDVYYVWRANSDNTSLNGFCPSASGDANWTFVCQVSAASNITAYNCIDNLATPGLNRRYLVGSSASNFPFGGVTWSCQDADTDRGFRAPPNPPSNPNRTTSTTGITFSFTGSSTFAETDFARGIFYRAYRTEQTTNNRCNASVSATQDLLFPSWNDTSPIPGVTYYYSVEARSPAGVSSCSNVTSAARGFPLPGASTALSASDGLFTDRVELNWSGPALGASVTGYQLFRNGSCSGTPLRTVSATSDADTPAAGSVVTYSVRAVGPGGVGSCSNADTGYIAPSAVTVVATLVSGTTNAIVSWSSSVGAAGYTVYRGTNCTGASVNVTTLSTTFTALGAGSHPFSVRPYISGLSYAPATACSNTASVTIVSRLISGRVARIDGTGLAGVTISASPGGASTVSGGDGSYQLANLLDNTYQVLATRAGYTFAANPRTVTLNGGNEVVNFTALTEPSYTVSGTIRLMPNNTALAGVAVSAGGSFANSNAAGTFSIAGLINGNYSLNANLNGYVVTPLFSNPVSINGASRAGLDFSATCAPGFLNQGNVCVDQNIAPGVPTGLQATDGTSLDAVNLTWQAPSSGGSVISYEIFRNASCSGTPLGQSSSPLSFADIAPPGTIFSYSVRAVGPTSAGGCSAADTGFRAPGQALNVVGTLVANSNTGTVAADPVAGARGYRIYRSADCSGVFQDLTSLPATIINLPLGVQLFTIRALSEGGVLAQATPCSASAAITVARYRIAGRATIASSAQALANVVVTLLPSGSTVTTDANGEYQFVDLWPGSYQLAAARSGYTIRSSFSNPVIIGSADELGRDFTASCASGYILSAGNCILDNSAPNAPLNLQAGDGTDEDFVFVTWVSSVGADNYDLYRSQFEGSTGAVLQAGIANQEFRDVSAVPGVQYYYTVKAKSVFGESAFSNTDRGFRLDPSGEADCDGDGVSDAQELIDGTGVCDPGSFQLHLKSPAFTKYNTFLEQYNFLELIATGIKTIDADVTVLAIDGTIKAVRRVSIQPRQQIDLDIHSLVGQRDTYGVVKIDFNYEPGATLAGRMSNYRQNGDRSYSFAFAKELRNPTRGATFASANSFDPQGRGYLVANWAEVINLDAVPRTIRFNLYTQQGALVVERNLELPPLGEVDLQAGHEFGEGVYLAEFRPIDGATKYFANVSRYGYNNAPGQPYSDFSFAFPLDSRMGTGDIQYLSLTNLTGGCWSQSNWAEVTNVREKSVRANLNFRNDRGQVLQSTEVTISPRAQFHFNGGILLPAGTVGSLQLSSSDPGALLSQSAVYYHDCQANTLQSSYATPGRIAGQDVQSGTFNTNLAMKNLLRVTSTTEATLSYATTLRSFNGFLAEQTSQLTSLRTNSIDTSAASSFATPTDLYGTLTIRTDAPRKFVAELLRLREVNGKVDFAMPTAVQ